MGIILATDLGFFMFEYRLQAKPNASKKAKGLKTMPDRFAHALTEMLNTEAKSGWEFVGQETFAVNEKSGMLKKAAVNELTFLVFRREIDARAVPLDQKLEKLKNKRAQTMVQDVAAPVGVEALSQPYTKPYTPPYTPPEEPTVLAGTEPFPEAMPAYVPEEPKADASLTLRLREAAPEQSLRMTSGQPTNPDFPEPPALNNDYSNGNTDASVDAPLLGPAKRD